jgi:hypothetical protein
VLSMADGTPHEQISRLEGRIEELAEAAERCRKIAIAARCAIIAGGMLLAAILLGVIQADALPLMLAAIFGIGGFVLYGSNDTTAKQLVAGINDAERQRAELIGQMELTLVPEPSRLLH